MIIVAFIAISVPFKAAFKRGNSNNFSYLLDLIFEIFFALDIMINFRTTFIESKSGRLITSPKEIAKHYFKGWFTVDLIAALPFEILFFLNHSNVSTFKDAF